MGRGTAGKHRTLHNPSRESNQEKIPGISSFLPNLDSPGAKVSLYESNGRAWPCTDAVVLAQLGGSGINV